MLSVLISAIVVHLFCIFSFSALLKILYYKNFIDMVIEYDILPGAYSRIWGSLLPFIELLAAFLLLQQSTLKYGAVVQLLLLFSFAYAVIMVLSSKRKLTCGCYGKLLDTEVDIFTLGKILFLSILSLLLLMTHTAVTIDHSLYSVGVGIYMTIFLLITQKVWAIHQESMRILRKNN
jgi:hypothetical protein